MDRRRCLISIVVPARNAAATLPAAITSVLAQGDSPTEIIVVDGASGDGSAAVARSFDGVLVLEQAGEGLADARNQGIAAASGRYVGFLDADDRYTPGRLAAMRAVLDRGADAVIGRMIRRPTGPIPPGYDPGWFDTPVPALTPGGLLARRETFATLGLFDTALTIACDSDYLARLERADLTVVHVDDVVLEKHVHAANLSRDVATYRRELLTIVRRHLGQQPGSKS